MIAIYCTLQQTQVQPTNAALTSVYEKEELKAQKEYYKKIRQEMGMKRARKLAFLQKLSVVYIPALALLFAILYWVIGLKQAEVI